MLYILSMKKAHQKISIFVTISIFLFTALFCCCLQRDALAKVLIHQAVNSDQSHLPACHRAANQTQKNTKSDCGCHKNISDFEAAKTDLKANSFEVLSFVYSSATFETFTYKYLSQPTINTSDGPPGSLSLTPLYLKHSILRI